MPKPLKVLEADPLHPKAIALFKEAGFEVHALKPYGNRMALLEAIEEVDVLLVRSSFHVDHELLKRALKLKYIGRAGAGMEQVDLKAAKDLGIICFNSPEGNRDAVAEQVIGMLLSLWQHLPKANKEVREGIWDRISNRGTELMGKTVGIVGLGNTGTQLAKKLQGFDVELLAVDPYRKDIWPSYVQQVSMEELCRNAHVVSFHVPLTQETKGMACRDWYQKLQQKPVIINTSRGKVVPTEALLEALENNLISGACLDVLDLEGLGFEQVGSKEGAKLWNRLVERPEVLLSPHTAGWTHESWEKISVILAQKILDDYYQGANPS
jgi:D-3-phosphoglycerate dehydrogenase